MIYKNVLHSSGIPDTKNVEQSRKKANLIKIRSKTLHKFCCLGSDNIAMKVISDWPLLLWIFMSMEFCIQQMKSRVTFCSSVMALNWVEIWSPFSHRLRMKCSSNTDIGWSYAAWNAWHAARFCLPVIPRTFKGAPLLNSYNFWSFRDDKAGKWR